MGLQEIKSLAFAFFWIDLLFLPAFQSVKLPFQGSLHHTKQYPDSWARNAKKSWIFQKIRLRNILRQECQASKYKTRRTLSCMYISKQLLQYLIFEEWDRKVFAFWKHETRPVFRMTSPAVWDRKSETVPNISARTPSLQSAKYDGWHGIHWDSCNTCCRCRKTKAVKPELSVFQFHSKAVPNTKSIMFNAKCIQFF